MRETAGMRTGAQRQVQRTSYSLAHGIVGNCNAVRDKLIEQGIQPGKVAVIYNGLEMKRLQTSLSRREALSLFGIEQADMQFVSIVANMRHEVKDYPMFLRAAQTVKAVVPGAAFLLAGEGELQDSLKALATELGISDCTYFLGRCDRVAELLGVSDVCVLSSKAEGFSNSIIEYMAAARPVVATDVGGAREAISEGGTGFLVPSGNDQQMAERIIRLLQSPDTAKQMGERGRQIVEEKFSCEAQLAQTEQLYERLLTGKEVS
jgi:glycosyltransferase involved in cell wall biosynthesis